MFAKQSFFFGSIHAPKIGSQGDQNQRDVRNHLPNQCLVEDVTLDIKPDVHVDFTIVKFSQIFFSLPLNRSSIIVHTINFIPKCDAFGLGCNSNIWALQL